MSNHNILPFIAKPGRYLGHEFNTVVKDWDTTTVHFALLFPDLYEIGMSHFGLQILYHILNQEKDVLAERGYCPDIDAEKVMRSKKIPLLSLESAKPISSFDVVGITLPYELCYSNILTILSLANLPFASVDRDDSHPLVIGGGSCSLNPEPIADFFDAIVLGDGEEVIVEVADIVKESKTKSFSRAETLRNLAQLKGLYIPGLYTPVYDSANKLKGMHQLADGPERIERRIIQDLNATAHLCKPIVPNARVVHDRLGIEIARGCTRGCRFCQAGMIYRPVRERSVEQILALAEQGIENSGFEELALLSLSTGDYSCIDHLLPKLMDRFEKEYVSVSMPSMRVGTLSPAVMDQIKRVRKTGFTVAPEAGSERLRQVINKGITEDDLLKTCKNAFAMGWNSIKLYFMIGLPTETIEDVEEIANLTAKTKKLTHSKSNKRQQVTSSVGTFVPKPHTPFQWEEQLSLEESRKRIHHLRDKMPRKGVKFKWHDPEMSFLEGVFSRGDRRLARLIETAWSLGARLDGWSDYFRLSTWDEAAEQCNIALSDYLRARNHDEILPWSHLSSGVDQEFLLEELDKAHGAEYTPDCRYHGCQNCGLCDFDTIMPIVHEAFENDTTDTKAVAPLNNDKNNQDEAHYKYVVSYSRVGDISYLGHLEILQLLFRSLRRAKIRTHFSKGFNPSPKISFGGALPVGMDSLAEYFIMDLPEPLASIEKVTQTLNAALPPGLTVTDIKPHSGQIPQTTLTTYRITIPLPLGANETAAISSFKQSSNFLMSRTRKGKTKEIDIRPLIAEMEVEDPHTLVVKMKASAGNPGVKLNEFLAHIFAWDEQQIAATRLTKISWQALTSVES